MVRDGFVASSLWTVNAAERAPAVPSGVNPTLTIATSPGASVRGNVSPDIRWNWALLLDMAETVILAVLVFITLIWRTVVSFAAGLPKSILEGSALSSLAVDL